jgi:hypothetical protein
LEQEIGTDWPMNSGCMALAASLRRPRRLQRVVKHRRQRLESRLPVTQSRDWIMPSGVSRRRTERVAVEAVGRPRTVFQDSLTEFRHVNRETARDLAVFIGLVTLGVFGRWAAEWTGWHNFTPTAAVALFAGFYFAHRGVGLLVPLTVMVVSNLRLSSYDGVASLLTVYLAFFLPTMLGWWMRRSPSVVRLGVCATVPAVVFFLVTNFAWWWFYNMYPHTWAGLIEGYVAGLPFFRAMLLADVLFSTALFGAYYLALATQFLPRDRQPVWVRRN